MGTYEGKFFNRAMDIFRQFLKLSIITVIAFHSPMHLDDEKLKDRS